MFRVINAPCVIGMRLYEHGLFDFNTVGCVVRPMNLVINVHCVS